MHTFLVDCKESIKKWNEFTNFFHNLKKSPYDALFLDVYEKIFAHQE